MMKLSGTQFGALQNAMQSAFPTPGALTQLLRVRLDVKYSEIVSPNANLTDAIFSIIDLMVARGRIQELIDKAVLENPSNPDLKQFVSDLSRGREMNVAAAEIDTALRVLRLADQSGQLGTLIGAACTGAGDLSELRSNVGRKAVEHYDPKAARGDMRKLAQEYEQVRASMSASRERTGRMGDVARRMRAISPGAAMFLREFATSQSPGERLVAVAILEESPDPAWVAWLGERIGVEKAFLGYHAAVGLRSAARLLDFENMQKIAATITAARRSLKPEDQNSDRAKMLDAAMASLASRTS